MLFTPMNISGKRNIMRNTLKKFSGTLINQNKHARNKIARKQLDTKIFEKCKIKTSNDSTEFYNETDLQALPYSEIKFEKILSLDELLNIMEKQSLNG